LAVDKIILCDNKWIVIIRDAILSGLDCTYKHIYQCTKRLLVSNVQSPTVKQMSYQQSSQK